MPRLERLAATTCALALCAFFSACTLQPNGSITLSGIEPTIVPTPSNGCYARNYIPKSGTLAAAISKCHARADALAQQVQTEDRREQERQAAEAARVEAQRAQRIEEASDHPTLGMKEFERDLGPDASALRYADLARSCNLRTRQWLQVIEFSYRNDLRREREKIPLTEPQAQVVMDHLEKQRNLPSKESCEQFSTSPQLSALDSFVSQFRQDQQAEILDDVQ